MNRKFFRKIANCFVAFVMIFGLSFSNIGQIYCYSMETGKKKTEAKFSENIAKINESIEKLVNKDHIKDNFERIAATPRVRGSKDNKNAGKYIFDTVKKYGYNVKFQNFNGYDEKLIDIKGNINKNQRKGKILFKGRNIIVKRKHSNTEFKTVIFSANYDSKNGSVGALDNAGGTVALMEMARILSDKKLPYNPMFVFFDSENLRRGSRHYVANLSKEEKEKIYGVININSIGNKEQRKQMFFALKKDKSSFKKQCEKYFSNIINYKGVETDAFTFINEKIPVLCYFTYDILGFPQKISLKKYVKEKDTSLVNMDTLVNDTVFITTYACMLKVV